MPRGFFRSWLWSTKSRCSGCTPKRSAVDIRRALAAATPCSTRATNLSSLADGIVHNETAGPFLTGWIDENTRFAPGDIRGVESRFSPENLPHNLALVELVQSWAVRKRATPAQVALAWLLAQKPWIVPIPGTTQMEHMLDNSAADTIRFTGSELDELNAAVRAVEVRGQRLPDGVLAFSGLEAPPNN